MQNIENKNTQNTVGDDTTRIEVEVEKFPVTRPKFTKEDWDSGEGSGQGEG